MDILYIILGITLLYFGGEWLLTGALSSAEKLNIPKVFSAVVLVGAGTSAPELFVAVNAMHSGDADIVLGNILGSNVANLLLIAGIGMVLAPMVHKIKFIGLESIFFILSSILLGVFMVQAGGIYGVSSYTMLVLLGFFFLIASRRDGSEEIEEEIPTMSGLRTVSYVGCGLITLLLGAESLVLGAVNLATYFGISQAVIGLSIVAVGTSLPELATTIAAARRNQGEMIVGNVLGSNIFNILLVLGVSSSMGILDLEHSVFGMDIVLGMIASIIYIALIYSRKLTSTFGWFFLLCYSVYIYTWTMR